MSYCKIEAPYPTAEAGEKRIIFALDPKGDEAEQEQYMLQLIPGRVLEMSRNDAANHQTLGGSIEQHTVEGWGAKFFHVKLAKQAASTLMHVHDEDHSEKVRKFVAMPNAPLFPYRSRCPVVVYLPNDAELRYGIWCGGQQMQAVTE
ncbi:ISP / inhibitor of serine peptidase [Leishmania donovani]|uniref:Ecotin family protein n=1 Tax=Leishmania donovani TaxID=5661 RepID=A0A3Q8I919_LEIDO|nr:ecotin, putative [Leishmania donovani]AYU77446.1 inhibitor of serine peptidase (ISP), putative [Leishmania donovani]TPP47770.1 Ecotin family protein [Leishmania donovani]TPP53118.1 Ecotin family protein [Leishmania donovani]CAJ1987460.1 ISP / inhibitor of serine peptidase [Leishmania donovani]CBZ32852.1 ecotin, putative [Leishmania donovani]